MMFKKGDKVMRRWGISDNYRKPVMEVGDIDLVEKDQKYPGVVDLVTYGECAHGALVLIPKGTRKDVLLAYLYGLHKCSLPKKKKAGKI